MYYPDSLVLLTLLTTATLSSAAAVGVGNAAASKACQGFAGGTLKCLTDVSYVICPGQNGQVVEQFVAAGTRCVKGDYGKKKDAIQGGVATATQAFAQVGPDGGAIGSIVVVPIATRTG